MSKTIEAENLIDVRKNLTGRLVRWSKNTDGSVTFFLSDGVAIQVRNVRVVEHGDHVRLRDRFNGHLLIPLSATRLKSRWRHSMLLSTLGLLVSLLLGLSANLGFHWFQKPKPTIEKQIEELDNVQASLSELQKYVSSQQGTLRELSESLHKLKEEKSTIETILGTDREKVQALLTYTGRRSPLDRWIAWGVAFLIGMFSSLVAMLLWNYFRNIRKIAQQEDAGDA